MPLPPKKGVGIMIAVGKPKEGPPPLDEPGQKKTGMGMMAKREETPEPASHEEAGVPANDFTGDIDSLSADYGLDSSTGRAFFKAALSSVLKSLGGEDEAVAEHDNGGANNEYAEE